MPEVSRIFKLNGQPVLTPSLLRGVDGVSQGWDGLANSISCPRGRQSGEAHFLVSDEVINALDLDQPITIECTHENGSSRWRKYYCIRTQAITSDSSPVHWITLADVRHIIDKATGTTGKMRYNLRRSKHAGSESEFIDYTTNGGVPWSWSEIVDDLWSLLPAAAGFVPSFSSPASSTPENLVFDGMSAWEALNQVLTAIGCAVCYEPLPDTFSIVSLATADTIPTFTNDRLLWNFRPQDLSVATLPEKAAVFIPWLPDNTDAPFPAKPIIVKRPLFETGIAGTEYVVSDTYFAWDDNTGARESRATEIATALRWLLDPVANRWGTVWAGCLSAAPNSRVTDVTWATDGEEGFTTTILYKPSHIEWPKLMVEGACRRNWLGFLYASYSGVVAGFWVVPTIALDGKLPDEPQWVWNIYKWDFGIAGATIRVEEDPYNDRWIPLQQEYICPDGRAIDPPPPPPPAEPPPYPYPE
jgi:hypothetical protein